MAEHFVEAPLTPERQWLVNEASRVAAAKPISYGDYWCFRPHAPFSASPAGCAEPVIAKPGDAEVHRPITLFGPDGPMGFTRYRYKGDEFLVSKYGQCLVPDRS